MAITVDEQVWEPQGQVAGTLGEALNLLHSQISKNGKVIVKVRVDGQELEGEQLEHARAAAIGQRAIALATDSRTELAKRMIGRLAALVEYMGKQHHHVASLIEQGHGARALEQLGSVLSAWQRIQQSYSALLQLLNTGLDDLMVREMPASEVLSDFHRQLTEIAEALRNQDMVLLADIMQYEMDSAVANWMGLLESVLGLVEGKDSDIQK
jgi:hypothetical protein